MARRDADRAGESRVAIVGAETPQGRRIRRALEEAGVPGGRVDLFGATLGQAVLSEYDGEARLIQEPDLESLAGYAAVFVCDASLAEPGGVEALAERVVVFDARGGARPPAAAVRSRLHVVPHFLGVALASLLAPLAAEPGIRRASAVVLRPAGDFGEAGVDELRAQTVNLLNFASVPTAVFGRQLAFNAIPHRTLDPGGSEDDVVAADAESLGGLAAGTVSLRMVVLPMFYGHAVLARVEATRPVTAGDVVARLEGARGIGVAATGAAATPLDAAERSGVVVSEVSDDGAGGVWIWAVIDDPGAVAANAAVERARAMVGF